MHRAAAGMFLVFPLTVLWEFTYCDFFGENALPRGPATVYVVKEASALIDAITAKPSSKNL